MLHSPIVERPYVETTETKLHGGKIKHASSQADDGPQGITDQL